MKKRSTKRQVVLPILQELKKIINTRADRRPAWFRKDFGLCWNFNMLSAVRTGHSRDLFESCKKQIKRWPLWTGDRCFIVPGREGVAPGIAYDDLTNKYSHQAVNGRNRHALLDHLIKEFSPCPSAN